MGLSGDRSPGRSSFEGHVAVGIDGPGRVPGNLPSMLIGIGDVAAKAAMRRCIGRPEEAPACRQESIHQRYHLVRSLDVVSKRESPWPGELAAVHVALQRLLQEGPEDEAVHLVKDDLLVLKDGLPSEALPIEAPRAAQIGNPEGDHRDALHGGPFSGCAGAKHTASAPAQGRSERRTGSDSTPESGCAVSRPSPARSDALAQDRKSVV